MRSRSTVVLTVCVGVFMVSLDLFIVNVAFPDIQKSFPGTSVSDLSWILSAYAIVFGALLLPAGRWADRVGRKHVFLLGLAIFTLASAAAALTPSVLTLVIARALQAVGAAMVFPTSLGLLLPEWPAEKRGTAVGIWSAVSGVAAAAGPPLGGLLVQADWRWVFIVNVPIGIVFFAVGWRVLVNRRDEQAAGRPDVIGAGLLALGIGGLILAIVQGQAWGWGGARIVGLFATAAVLLAIVAVRCATHPVPLVEPVIVRTRAIAFANLSAIGFFMSFATLVLGLVLFQTQVWHLSVLRTGLQIAPAPLTSAFFAVPGALLGQRFGHRYVGAAGALLCALSGFWLRAHVELEPNYASDLLPAGLIGGAGVGLLLPTLSAAATGPLPPSRFATGTAVLGMTRQVGSALGVAVFVAILGEPTPATILDAFRDGWTFQIAGAIAAGVALLAIGPVRAPALPGSGQDAALDTGRAGLAPAGSYTSDPFTAVVER